MKKISVGLVGTSGLVGQTILKVLEEYKITPYKLVLYGSSRTAGKSIMFNNKEYLINELCEENIDKSLDIVFFAVDNQTSEQFAHLFTLNNTYVIDNSSLFRLEKTVPLVVPEINMNTIKKDNYLISNPNCTTIQSVICLSKIKELFGLKRVDYTSYQAVSGSGIAGIDDLKNNSNKIYPFKIKDNLIPVIDSVLLNGYTKEEEKMINETHKILNDYSIEIAATCIRVPIENTHGVSIRVETYSEIDLELLLDQLDGESGIILRNDSLNDIYPLRDEAENQDKVLLGRIRKDLYNKKIIHMYCVADNLRKGASSNSVQIARYIIDEYL